MSVSYIKQQLMSTDQTKIIYPQTKAEIVWREDLSSTVESSLQALENAIGLDSSINNNLSLSQGTTLGTISLLQDNTVISSSGIKGLTINDDLSFLDTSNMSHIVLHEDNWSDYITIPEGSSFSLSLNGTSTSSPSFYAPTTPGTSGYYLKSNGSGEPSWSAMPTSLKNPAALTIQKNGTTVQTYDGSGAVTANIAVPTITLNGSSTTSPSFYAPTTAGTSGYVLKSNGSGAPSWVSATLTDTKVTTAVDTSSTKSYVTTCTGATTGGLTYHSSVYVNHSTGVLMGAAWNDYAEYREQIEKIEPGYCVASANNGKVYKTTEKFQACDGIVSDTFGFAIGETEKCQTPLAVAGRVLVYCDGDRNNYNAGDVVCAGPNGKAIKMTREEIHEWPDRIIGIVSEIPEYETWGTGNIKVNGRIWIKVK